MGYNIQNTRSKFVIKKENYGNVVKAIHGLAGKESIEDSSGKHFSWVNNDFVDFSGIIELFAAWRWSVEENDFGINCISFDGQKLGNDHLFFNTIAPYVENGSFIEIMGEDGCIWRWFFKDGKMKTVKPVWPPE